jgi:hypothetical protein
VDPAVRAAVLAQEITHTRGADDKPVEVTAPAVQGIAPSFDSAEATQRLAALTGTASQPAGVPQTTTQFIKSMPQVPVSLKWRRRDWLLVGAAAVLGLVVALLKILR